MKPPARFSDNTLVSQNSWKHCRATLRNLQPGETEIFPGIKPGVLYFISLN